MVGQLLVVVGCLVPEHLLDFDGYFLVAVAVVPVEADVEEQAGRVEERQEQAVPTGPLDRCGFGCVVGAVGVLQAGHRQRLGLLRQQVDFLQHWQLDLQLADSLLVGAELLGEV